MKRIWAWIKTWRLADLNAYAAHFTLILACVHLVIMLVGSALGKDTGDDALWVLSLTACSLGFRALARLDELAHELRDRAEALAAVVDAQEKRLAEMDSRLSTVVVRVRREVP